MRRRKGYDTVENTGRDRKGIPAVTGPDPGKEADMLFKESFLAGEGNFRVKAVAFPLSVVVHVLLGLSLVILPLTHAGRLPVVDMVIERAFPAPAPPGPPPGKRPGNNKPGTKIPSIKNQPVAPGDKLVAPMDIPDGILEEPIGNLGFGGDGFEGGVEGAPRDGFFKGIVGPVIEEVIGKIEVPIRAGIGEVKPPKLIRRVDPIYPKIAIEARIQGEVIIEATTDPYGRVIGMKVRQSVPLLDEAALEAVRQWIYEPMVINGRPRSVEFTVTVVFKLT